MSLKMKAKYASGELVAKPPYLRGERHGMYGKKHTLEARQKMSLASMGRKHTDEWKEQQRQRCLGKFLKPVDFTDDVIDGLLRCGNVQEYVESHFDVRYATFLMQFKQHFGYTIDYLLKQYGINRQCPRTRIRFVDTKDGVAKSLREIAQEYSIQRKTLENRHRKNKEITFEKLTRRSGE